MTHATHPLISAIMILVTLCSATVAAAADSEAHDLLVQRLIIPGGISQPAERHPMMPTAPMTGARYIKLVYPSAIAAHGPDLFVADSGLASLLRIDVPTQGVARLGTIPALPGVRLFAARDGSLYLLRPDRSEVSRLSRDGRVLVSFADLPEIPQPSALAVEPTLNALWVADGMGELHAMAPLGRRIHNLPDGGPPTEVSLLAAGRHHVFGYAPLCRCIVRFDNEGRPLEQFAEGAITAPSALAVDAHDRLWVVDRGDGKLKVFDGDALVATVPPMRLGLTEFTALAIDSPQLFLADGPGGRIGVFDILPPPGAPR